MGENGRQGQKDQAQVIFLQVRESAFDDIVVISKSMDFTAFDCGNDDFNDYLEHEALEDQKNHISVTYVGIAGGRPTAFVTLVAAAYRTEFLKTTVQGVHRYRQIPALKIARIATDRTCQRQGCGEALIQHSVAIGFAVQELIGCKLIITGALPDKVQWYERQGFVSTLKPEHATGRENCPMYAVLSG